MHQFVLPDQEPISTIHNHMSETIDRKDQQSIFGEKEKVERKENIVLEP